MRRISSSLRYGILAAVLSALAVGISMTAREYTMHARAPDITFTTINGTRIDLASWHGKPVLITFWASSCPTCLKEIPLLIALYQDYHAQGLEMIAIAIAGDVPSHVVALAQAYPLPYPVALDPQNTYAQAFGGIAVTPVTLLISPEGFISQRIIGPFDSDALRAQITAWLQR